MLVTQMTVKPQVIKLHILTKVIQKVILLTVHRNELAFCTQAKRFLIEDDVKIFLHNDLELLLPPKLKAKVLNKCPQKNSYLLFSGTLIEK